MKPTFHRLAALGLLAITASPLLAQSNYSVGEPLPALRLPDVSGERTLDLASFRGKKLVLFEFASW